MKPPAGGAMSPAERLKVLLFLALFSGATGAFFTLLCCGTDYWLLAAESCSRRQEEEEEGNRMKNNFKMVTPGLTVMMLAISHRRVGESSTWPPTGPPVFMRGDIRERGVDRYGVPPDSFIAAVSIHQTEDGVRMFHQGLFWRCFFTAAASDFSIRDLWITNQPVSKICQAAFLFPFPAHPPAWAERSGFPSEPYQRPSAIVFRTFWSIFLISAVMAVVIGGLLVLCAAPLTNHSLYSAGGALQVCGGWCLLGVVVMYLMWVLVLDTLEQLALHGRASGCPSYHLSIRQGPSFLLAPVAIFFCLLAGLLFILLGRSVQGLDETNKSPEASETEL